MQPKSIPQNSAAPASNLGEATGTGLSAQWRQSLAILAVAIAALFALTFYDWLEMFHQWWNVDTYSHILLIPFIIAWLVWMKREEVMRLNPAPWWPGLLALAGALTVWAIGRVTGINLLAHVGAAGSLQAIVMTMLGLRISAMLLLPIGFVAALVPFGDELIPMLQSVTADITIVLTRWSGVPAVIDGIHIDTPVGLFVVAEACSGVKFLIAMIALGVLVCFTAFNSWRKRAAFMLACVVVPILANGVRAWGTIYIAQSQGVEFAAGFDHIIYGWVFFAIVMAILVGGAWSFFEREPEDAGYTLAELNDNALIARLDAPALSAKLALGAIVALGALAALAVVIVNG